MTLPTSGNPRLIETHPEFIARLERFFEHPDIKGKFKVGWAVRTEAKQRLLYAKWLSGRGNLAANPDRVIGVTEEGWTAKGSWHMVQEDGHSYAVDLTKPIWMTKAKAKTILDRVLPEFGLRRTVPTEWWHIQPRYRWGWYFDPSAITTMESGMFITKDTETSIDCKVWGLGATYFYSTQDAAYWAGIVGPERVFVTPHIDTLIARGIPVPTHPDHPDHPDSADNSDVVASKVVAAIKGIWSR